MRFIAQLKMQWKLALLTAIAATGFVIIGWFGQISLQSAEEQINSLMDREIAAVKRIGEARAGIGDLRRYEKDMFLNMADLAKVTSYRDRWRKEMKNTSDLLGQIEKLLTSDSDRQHVEKLRAGLQGYGKGVEQIAADIEAGKHKTPAAANSAMESFKAEVRAADGALEELTASVLKAEVQERADLAASEQYAMKRNLFLGAGLLLLMVLASWVIQRQIKRSLTSCVNAISSLEAGDLSFKLDTAGRDEFAQLGQSMESLRGSIQRLIGDMNNMAQEHEKGDIDAVIDSQKFSGDFRTVAQGLNDMVGAHIAMNRMAMGVVREFGNGNFNAPLDKLPGKKAFINETIESVRSNLKGIIAEMNRMAEEHEKGDIDVVIDSQKFEGDFRTVAQGVNDMVGAHIAVKKLALGVVREFGSGNFNAPLDKLPGKKAFVNETIEQVRGNLKALIEDASMLAQAAVAGQLARAPIHRATRATSAASCKA